MNRKSVGQGIKGFTLIEVLVALCLLMVILLPLTTIMSVNNRQVVHNEKTLKAKHLAQSKIEEIKAMSWYDFKTTYLEDMESQTLQKNATELNDAFTYRVKVWPSDNYLIYTIQITVFYQEAGRDKWQSLYSEKLRK